MKTKQQIQEEIAELQKQLEKKKTELDDLNTDYVLNIASVSGWRLFIENPLILQVSERTPGQSKCRDQPHGLGKYKTQEYAEHARAALIGLLRILKQLDGVDRADASQYNIYLHLRKYGQETIKAIEEGTYE